MRGDGGEVPQIHLCRRAGFVVGRDSRRHQGMSGTFRKDKIMACSATIFEFGKGGHRHLFNELLEKANGCVVILEYR
jgi:hypothetical protein